MENIQEDEMTGNRLKSIVKDWCEDSDRDGSFVKFDDFFYSFTYNHDEERSFCHGSTEDVYDQHQWSYICDENVRICKIRSGSSTIVFTLKDAHHRDEDGPGREEEERVADEEKPHTVNTLIQPDILFKVMKYASPSEMANLMSVNRLALERMKGIPKTLRWQDIYATLEACFSTTGIFSVRLEGCSPDWKCIERCIPVHEVLHKYNYNFKVLNVYSRSWSWYLKCMAGAVEQLQQMSAFFKKIGRRYHLFIQDAFMGDIPLDVMGALIVSLSPALVELDLNEDPADQYIPLLANCPQVWIKNYIPGMLKPKTVLFLLASTASIKMILSEWKNMMPEVVAVEKHIYRISCDREDIDDILAEFRHLIVGETYGAMTCQLEHGVKKLRIVFKSNEGNIIMTPF